MNFLCNYGIGDQAGFMWSGFFHCLKFIFYPVKIKVLLSQIPFCQQWPRSLSPNPGRIWCPGCCFHFIHQPSSCQNLFTQVCLRQCPCQLWATPSLFPLHLSHIKASQSSLWKFFSIVFASYRVLLELQSGPEGSCTKNETFRLSPHGLEMKSNRLEIVETRKTTCTYETQATPTSAANVFLKAKSDVNCSKLSAAKTAHQNCTNLQGPGVPCAITLYQNCTNLQGSGVPCAITSVTTASTFLRP